MAWQIKNINALEVRSDGAAGGAYRMLSNTATGILSAFDLCAASGGTPALPTTGAGTRIQVVSLYVYSAAANTLTFNNSDSDVKLVIPIAAGAAVFLSGNNALWTAASAAGLNLTSAATIDSIQLLIRQYNGTL